ncbi:hypothetical protein E2C01_069381 [Portunus trituberculatus]|uniref:Uncharacterized protein n=1 Tax=Portunus trituberculatus TaxID=210409 RepID=A0A5B7I214_PORTR|nr:hypothetical protein [Portunus trituberculatus]
MSVWHVGVARIFCGRYPAKRSMCPCTVGHVHHVTVFAALSPAHLQHRRQLRLHVGDNRTEELHTTQMLINSHPSFIARQE